MCIRVDVLIRCTRYPVVYVACPTCGRWGTLRKGHTNNSYQVSHKNGSANLIRCSATWNPRFQRFAQGVMTSLYHINQLERNKNIRSGYLPINIPVVSQY